MAIALIYAGYSHIILGDAMCEAVFDVAETISSQAQVYERGLSRFEEGMQVAGAAGAGTSSTLPVWALPVRTSTWAITAR